MISKAKRQRIFDRHKWRCHWCGLVLSTAAGLATIDHVRPRSKGGTDEESNLVASCEPCNHRRGDALPGDGWRWSSKETRWVPTDPLAGL